MTPRTRYDKLRDNHVVHVEAAVREVLAQGFRTGDIFQDRTVGTGEIGDTAAP